MMIPQIVYILSWMVGRICHFYLPWRPFAWVSLCLFITWWGMCAYGYFIGRFHFQVKPFTYMHSLIPPSFDGYRIVQISDLHLQSWENNEKKLQQAVQKINSLQPDLIVITGDLVSFDYHEVEPFVETFRELKARDGVVSVMGNHDYFPYNRGLTKTQRQTKVDSLMYMQRRVLKWKLLMNEHLLLNRGRDHLAIIGVENQSCGTHRIICRGQLEQAMKGTEGLFKILLSHDPSHWRAEVLSHTDIPLMLSGHTHAMQFRFLGLTPSMWAYPECDGRYDEAGQTLYVNIGLGGTLIPMRIGARPEITLITLKRQ